MTVKEGSNPPFGGGDSYYHPVGQIAVFGVNQDVTKDINSLAQQPWVVYKHPDAATPPLYKALIFPKDNKMNVTLDFYIVPSSTGATYASSTGATGVNTGASADTGATEALESSSSSSASMALSSSVAPRSSSSSATVASSGSSSSSATRPGSSSSAGATGVHHHFRPHPSPPYPHFPHQVKVFTIMLVDVLIVEMQVTEDPDTDINLGDRRYLIVSNSESVGTIWEILQFRFKQIKKWDWGLDGGSSTAGSGPSVVSASFQEIPGHRHGRHHDDHHRQMQPAAQ